MPREGGASSTPRLLDSSLWNTGSPACAFARDDNGMRVVLAALSVRVFPSTLSPQREGAGNAGCLLHPRSRVQCARGSAHTSIQLQPKHAGIPCAMV